MRIRNPLNARRACLLLASILLVSAGAPPARAQSIFPYPVAETDTPTQDVSAVDLNRDGLLDLIAARTPDVIAPVNADEVTVHLGLGGGEFAPAVAYGVALNPQSVSVADFNGDGDPDIAVRGGVSGLSILLNRGDGSFQPEVRVLEELGVIDSMALGDLNGDALTDLATVVRASGTLLAHLGRGDGTFEPPSPVATDPTLWSVALGDFNADGRLDVAAGQRSQGLPFPTAQILLFAGRGDGQLDSYGAAEFVFLPESMIAADMNGDGRDDLVVGDSSVSAFLVYVSGSDGVPVLRDGTERLGFPGPAAALDVDGDGMTDLVFVSIGGRAGRGGAIYVAPGTGAGDLSSSRSIFPGESFAIGDVDPDGRPDLVVGSVRMDGLRVLPGHGDGSFGVRYRLVEGFPRAPVVGDFDADGRSDVAMARGVADEVVILFGAADGTLGSERRVPAGDGPVALVKADFDLDGIEDLASLNNRLCDATILRGLGDGAFAAPLGVPIPFIDCPPVTSLHLGAGDFDGDGDPDLVAVTQTDSAYPSDFRYSVLLNQSDGIFTLASQEGAGVGVSALAVADFDRDGMDDFVTLGGQRFPVCSGPIPCGVALEFRALGGGLFEPPARLEVSELPQGAAAVDLNGDAYPDLASGGNGVVVHFGGPQGLLSLPPIVLDRGAQTLTSADFNADGIFDLAMTGFRILLGSSTGAFAPEQRFLGAPGNETAAGDFNGDGRQDLFGLTWDLFDPNIGDFVGSVYAVALNQSPFPVQEVTIDIRPGTDPNFVGLGSRGMLPVAILGDSKLDASLIDPRSVTLAGTPAAAPGGDPLCHLEDVDADGRLDLLCQFRVVALGLEPGPNTLTLEARTTGGRGLRGEDSVLGILPRRHRLPG